MILEPLPPCYRKKGHRFELIVPMHKTGDVSQCCPTCGMVRQFPVKSPEAPLDSMSADEIIRRVGLSL